MSNNESFRIETKEEVQSYIAKLKYALDHGAKISIQYNRKVDENRPIENTNRFTLADLFPSESPEIALKRELKTLSVQEYLRTVKDIRFQTKVKCVSLEEYSAGQRRYILKSEWNF